MVGRNSQYTRRLPSDDIRLAPQAALMGELDDENAPPALVLRKSGPLYSPTATLLPSKFVDSATAFEFTLEVVTVATKAGGVVGVGVPELVFVRVGVLDPDPVGVPLGVLVGVPEPVGVPLGVLEGVGVPEGVPELEGVGVGVTE